MTAVDVGAAVITPEQPCNNVTTRHLNRLNHGGIGDKLVFSDDAVVRQKYPLLAAIYGSEFDPHDNNIKSSIRLLLSEIMHLLEASHEGLTVKDCASHAKVSYI